MGSALPHEVHLPPIEGGGKRCDGRAKVVPPPARPPSTGLRTCFEWPQDEQPRPGMRITLTLALSPQGRGDGRSQVGRGASG